MTNPFFQPLYNAMALQRQAGQLGYGVRQDELGRQAQARRLSLAEQAGQRDETRLGLAREAGKRQQTELDLRHKQWTAKMNAEQQSQAAFMAGNLLKMDPGLQPAAYGALIERLNDPDLPLDWFRGGQEWAQWTAGLAGTAPMAAAPKPVLGKVPEGHVYIPDTGLQQMEGYTPPVEEKYQPPLVTITPQEGREPLTARLTDLPPGFQRLAIQEQTGRKGVQPPTAKMREARADVEQRLSYLPDIQALEPGEAYRRSWRMNDDGSVFLDENGAPIKLPVFTKRLGKRGQIKAIMEVGETRDDAVQLLELLKEPQAAAQLRSVWDSKLLSMTANSVRKWLAERGLGGGDVVGEIIWRIHRLASAERKKLLGAAVTQTELRSTLAWMPEASDNLEEIIQKSELGASEMDEHLYRWLDLYKDVSNMSPFYEAFGLDRFKREDVGETFLRPTEPPKPNEGKLILPRAR
jgi:hypothetical protein